MDIVERLRFLASGQDDAHSVAIDEAADEIERLLRQINMLVDDRDALMAEIERLRARLATLEAELKSAEDIIMRAFPAGEITQEDIDWSDAIDAAMKG